MSKGKLAQLVMPLWALVYVMAVANEHEHMAWGSAAMLLTLGIFLAFDAFTGGTDE